MDDFEKFFKYVFENLLNLEISNLDILIVDNISFDK